MSGRKPDDLKRLEHIRDSLDQLSAFVQGFDETSFANDRKTFLSSVKLIEIIGESTKDRFTQIPWRQIEGMRHRLVHEYYAIDTLVAWKVATVFGPQLRSEIEAMMSFVKTSDY